ncbi:MAG: MerR family transcriptional regulator [Bryobacterales bacterium]|nr:MerR family transcriptional regulator [Bryobacterales bacterium]
MIAKSFTLDQLADASGVSRRTIRFWISRGLVPGPDIAGRNASYSQSHLARLLEIQSQQEQGLTLREISTGAKSSETRPVVAPIAWWQIPVADGVQVWVQGNLSPWRQRAVRRAIAEFGQRLAEISTEESQ